jgi:hypothetical protein
MNTFTMISNTKSSSVFLSPQAIGLVSLLVTLYIGYIIYQAFFGKLSKIPGPSVAKFSNIWRVKTAASGHAPAQFQKLHRQYGSVVRTGPTHISVSDPEQIPVIYGISSKFIKASLMEKQQEISIILTTR